MYILQTLYSLVIVLAIVCVLSHSSLSVQKRYCGCQIIMPSLLLIIIHYINRIVNVLVISM